MTSVSPVLTEFEVGAEQVIALDQREYFPIIVVRIGFQDKDGEPTGVASLTRYRFTDAEREAIGRGADLLLSQPHHGPLMPIGLQLAMPDAYPLPESV
jgi:hypothetical protein